MKNRRGSKDPNGIARTLCERRFGKFFHFLENSASNYVFSASSTLSMRFITFLRFDFYFQGRITSRWTRFFLPANVWPEVKGRNLPPRLNDSRWHGQRAIDFPRFSRPRNRFARLPFENPAGIYSVKICRSTQQIATPDLWSRPATINLFTIYRFTPWGKQRAHTLHHNHDA